MKALKHVLAVAALAAFTVPASAQITAVTPSACGGFDGIVDLVAGTCTVSSRTAAANGLSGAAGGTGAATGLGTGIAGISVPVAVAGVALIAVVISDDDSGTTTTTE